MGRTRSRLSDGGDIVNPRRRAPPRRWPPISRKSPRRLNWCMRRRTVRGVTGRVLRRASAPSARGSAVAGALAADNIARTSPTFTPANSAIAARVSPRPRIRARRRTPLPVFVTAPFPFRTNLKDSVTLPLVDPCQPSQLDKQPRRIIDILTFTLQACLIRLQLHLANPLARFRFRVDIHHRRTIRRTSSSDLPPSPTSLCPHLFVTRSCFPVPLPTNITRPHQHTSITNTRQHPHFSSAPHTTGLLH
jgi:hypothetical protein